MKRKITGTVLVVLAIMLCFSSALAAGRVTQTYSPNREANSAFWSYMKETMAPWLAENPQEKWSVERCRRAADKLEAGGFVISEGYKDMLYRQKREHRWHAGEALGILIRSQIGEEWMWSLEDYVLTKEVSDAARIISSRYIMPPEEGPTLEEVIALCREEAKSRYGFDDETLDAYDMRAFLDAYGEDVLFTVNLTPDVTQEYYQVDVTFEYYWPSDVWTSFDYRR